MKITVLFEDITPVNAVEKCYFTKNRRIAFSGSKMDFIRSLYRKECYKNGFTAVAVHQKPNYQKQRIVRLLSDAISQTYADNGNKGNVTLSSITNGNKGTIYFYEQKLGEPTI